MFSSNQMIPMSLSIDEDSQSEEDSDPDGSDLMKGNIDVKNFISDDYRNLLQEAYTAHFAVLEEKSKYDRLIILFHNLFLLFPFNLGIKQINLKDHILVIFIDYVKLE